MTKRAERKLDSNQRFLLKTAGFLTVALAVVFGLVHAPKSWAQSPTNNANQDLTGTWQGTIQFVRGLRIVIQISKADGGAWKAVSYSIDRDGQPIPVTSITLEGSAVNFSIKGRDVSYLGPLNPDGNSIAGSFTQNGQTAVLNLQRATPETAWTIPPPPPPISPMADNADPSLEVATIKLSPPDEKGKGFGFNGHEFTTRNMNLNDLLAIAYGVHTKQIVDAPDWANSVLYDITGIPDAPGRPNLKQQGILIKKLLVDRFQLKSHSETRVLSVYAITVAKVWAEDDKGHGSRECGDGVQLRRGFRPYRT
jgi:hypothetical protein